MIVFVLTLVFVTILVAPKIKKFWKILNVPGPILPKGIKGDYSDWKIEPGFEKTGFDFK